VRFILQPCRHVENSVELKDDERIMIWNLFGRKGSGPVEVLYRKLPEGIAENK
jgi:hypothetical protein